MYLVPFPSLSDRRKNRRIHKGAVIRAGRKGAGAGKLRTLLGWGVDIVAVIALALFVVMMFGDRIAMSGRSMEPTLNNGDVVLLNKLWYNFTGPDRMDVVAFEVPGDDTKIYIKRIVGLPGETVQIRDGALYIDGRETPVPGCPGLFHWLAWRKSRWNWVRTNILFWETIRRPVRTAGLPISGTFI